MDIIALSPHEPLADRLDALNETKSKDIARKLCKDETCPGRLRQEALLILDGSNEEDLLCALSSYIPVQPQEVREVAGRLIQLWVRTDVLNEIAGKLAVQAERFLLLGIWGLCVWVREHGRHEIKDIPINLLDSLSSIAGKQFLADSVTTSELMGSHRSEALAALCIRWFGVFLDPNWVKVALADFHKAPLRALSVNSALKECPVVSNVLIILVLCEALEVAVQNDDKLRKWNELWYFGTSPDKDDGARKMDVYARQFALEAYPLLLAIGRWCASNITKETDPAVATRIVFLLSSWTSEKGINLPWVAEESHECAQRCIRYVIDTVGPEQVEFDCEELRLRLAHDKWKTDWPGTAALVCIAIHSPEFGSLIGADTHLMPTLLPLADDIDPRVAGPAWRALLASLAEFQSKDASLLFRAIDRGLTCRDAEQYALVTECLQAALRRFDSDTFQEHERFLEKLCRDMFYSASSSPDLYSIAVENCMCFLVSTSGLFGIRLLPLMLDAVRAGSQKRVSCIASLNFLNTVLSACEPRIKAHRGEVFTILLRQSVNAGDTVDFAACVHRFRTAIGPDHQGWMDAQVEKLKATGLDSTFQANSLEAID